MRLFIKIDGCEPGMIVAYPPSENGVPMAIVICGSSPSPICIPLSRCLLPKIPKRLERKIRSFYKRETIEAQIELASGEPVN